MDLLGFIKEANFKADAREIIKLFKWNLSLKRKLDTNLDDVTITVEEALELLETIYQMVCKIKSGNVYANRIQINNSKDDSRDDASALKNANNIKIVCGDDNSKETKLVDTDYKKVVD